MFQTKEQDKNPETDLNELEIVIYLIQSSKQWPEKCSLRSEEQCLNKVRISTRRKYKKVPNRNDRAEEYNN